jgi:tetratricopeptide (TPR) repeat protein
MIDGRARRVKPFLPLVGSLLVLSLFAAPNARADAYADGKKLMKDGKYEEAIPLLKQAVADDPSRPEAQIALGQSLEKRRHWKDALDAYDAAAKLDPRSAEAQRGRGFALIQLNRNDEAVQALQQATDLDHKFPEAQLALGDALVKQKKYDDAVNVLTEGTKWGPKVAPYFYEHLGMAEAARGNYKDAEVQLLKAREMSPQTAEFHRALGDLYMERKIPNLATLSYQQAISLDADDLDSRFAMARALANDSRYNEALDQYKEIIQRDSLYAEAYKEMGDIYVRASDTDPHFLPEAQRNLEKYMKLQPDDPEGSALLARAYYKLGRRDEALQLIQPAAAAGTLSPDGHLIYARLAYDKQDFPTAVKEFSLASAKMDEYDARRLAQSLQKTGRPDAADSIFAARFAADSTAGKPMDKASDWILERAKLRYSMGKKDSTQYGAAVPLFQRKIALDPKSDEAYYYWGLSLREVGKFQDADQALQQAVQLAPNKPDRHFWYAVNLVKLDRNPDARREFQAVAGLDSTSSMGAIARQRLGYYLLLEKNWAGAVDQLEPSVRIDPKQPQSWTWLGQGYQNSGQKQKAMEAYHKALELDPNQPDAKKGLAQIGG